MNSSTPLHQREFERILLIKPSSLGDLIHALPVLRLLRQRYPSAHIAWLVATPFVELLEGHPDLAEVIPFDRKRFGSLGLNPRVNIEFFRFVKRLRAQRFDLVVDLQGLFRSGFLARATGAGVRIGFADARELAPVFYSHRIPSGEREVHAIRRNMRIASLLGVDDREPEIILPIRPDARSRFFDQARVAGWLDNQPYAVVLPCARWETKQWPAEYFTEVVRGLQDQFGLRTLLVGSPDEAATTRRIAEQTQNCGAVDLGGKTSIAEMLAGIEAARLVVCNDSGPMHIAAALNRPLVALFGPTSPIRTGPFGHEAGVLHSDIPCAPCYLKRFTQCPYDHRCLREISAQGVLEHVGRLLAESSSKDGSNSPMPSADMYNM